MKKIQALMSGFMVVAASQAYAGIPSISNNCKKTVPQVLHPDNGTRVMYDEECTTAYVLPPATGTAELKALSRNANLQFCPAVLKAGKTADSLATAAVSIGDRLEKMVSDYDPLREQLTQIQELLIDAQAEATRLAAQLEAVNAQKIEKLGEYQQIKSDLEACRTFGNDCTELTQQKIDAEKEYLALKKQGDKLQLDRINADATVSQLRGRKLQMESELTAATDNLIALLNQLGSVNTLIMDTYKTWAGLEAATGQLVYSVNWKNLVNKYAELNPAFSEKGITFTPVPIVDGRFYATMKVKASQDAPSVLPGLLSATVPGVQAYGVTNLGEAGSVTPIPANVTDAPAEGQGTNLNETMLNYSGVGASSGMASVSGQVQLSLMGACPYFKEGLASPPKESISSADLAAYLVVNANLDYDVKVARKYKASFNLSKLVERIEEVASKKRWFFKTEDLHKIMFTGNASSWFDIKFDVDSSDLTFTTLGQDTITKEVKADLVERATEQIAVVAGEAPGVPAHGQSGYDKNPKVPCVAWYCKGTNFLLGVGEGFFGSKSAVSQFKVQNSSWVSDNVHQTKVIRHSQILTFVPENTTN